MRSAHGVQVVASAIYSGPRHCRLSHVGSCLFLQRCAETTLALYRCLPELDSALRVPPPKSLQWYAEGSRRQINIGLRSERYTASSLCIAVTS